MIESARYAEHGSIIAVIDGVQMIVPDDMGNRHRQLIAEWEAEGNTIPPYEPPTIEQLLGKRVEVEEGGIATAWSNYNGVSTQRNSLGVSSLVDNGTGTVTLNFANAFVDDGYIVTGTAVSPGVTNGLITISTSNPTATSCTLATITPTQTVFDASYSMFLFHGDLA